MASDGGLRFLTVFLVLTVYSVKGADVDGFLLVAVKIDIIQFDLHNEMVLQYRYFNLTGAQVITSVAFDPMETRVYWADNGFGMISSCYQDVTDIDVIISNAPTVIHGLAIDEINRKIYWSDYEHHKIERANLDGSSREVIVTSGLFYPRTIIVDTEDSVIYWMNLLGKIEKSSLDGTNRQTLFVASAGRWSYGLAFDKPAGKMYWTDSFQFKDVKMLDYNLADGTSNIFLTFPGSLSYGVDIVGDYIYWTGVHSDGNKLGRADKKTGDNVEYIYLNTTGTAYAVKFNRVYNSFDPCKATEYKDINDRYRSKTFSSSNWSNMTDFICDSDLEEGWYRFSSEAGGEMPTSCVEMGMCGTEYPVWIDDQRDNYLNITQVRGCINKDDGNCCSDTLDISVKDCGNFTVYKLKPLQECPAAYCAGDKEPCPLDQNSPNGFQPGCTDTFPKLTGNPTLSVSTEYMTCRFNAPLWSNSTFTMEWMLDEDIIKTEELEYKLQHSRLYAEHYQLGKTVKCRVSASFKNSNVSSRPVDSNGVFVGLIVAPFMQRLAEDGPSGTISIHATVPLSCHVKLVAERNYLGRSDIVMDTCTIDIYEDTYSMENIIKVFALRDCLDDGGQITSIEIIPSSPCSVPIDPKYKEIVKIETSDKRCGRCQGTGDPHYSTFDNKAFDWYGIGDYTFTRSKSRLFEVLVRTWKCFGVSCHCGVIVREGNDVITVDMCYGKFKKTAPQVIKLSQGNLSKGVHITRDKAGKRFEITMPSGAAVRVNAYNWGLDIYLEVPSDEYNKSEGLCGTFDDDSNNDYTMANGNVLLHSGRRPDSFADSWRVGANEGLFNTIPNTSEDGEMDEFKYCSCFRDDSSCSYGNEGKPTLNTNNIDITASINNNDISSVTPVRRKRRSTENSEDVSWYRYTPDPTFVPANVSWPTPSGITEQEARDLCKSAVTNSSAAAACGEIPGVDIFTGVEGCVEDIKFSDSTEFLLTAISEMQNNCQEQVLKNVSLYDIGDNGTVIATPPRFLQELICPGECSGNGICVNGTCQCVNEFLGADCSIDSSKPPEVLFINGEEQLVCDIRQDDCATFSIIGDNFLDSEDLICYLNGKMTAEIDMEVPKYTKVRASMRSFREVFCDFGVAMVVPGNPDLVKGVTIKPVMVFISNDNGKTVSEGLPLTTYDSRCQDCNEDGKCQMKLKSCEINGHCFEDKEFHPTDKKRQCQPDNDRFHWTEITDNDDEVAGDNGKNLYIIVMIIGVANGVAFCFVICGVIYVCNKSRRNRRRANKVI